MARGDWREISLLAIYALGCELFVSFGLCFAPGWANEWPFGLSIYTVWPAGMATLLFAFLMTVAVGFGAEFAPMAVNPRTAKRLFRRWLLCAAVVALALSGWAFVELRAETLRMFPNGYNPRAAAQGDGE